MQTKHRVLMAAQPAAAALIQGMLQEAFDLIPVQTSGDGFAALDREPNGIAVVICTIAFEDSRMLEFLQAVKRHKTGSGIPFVCCRVLSTVLPHDSMDRLGFICKYLGAADFIDFPSLEKEHGMKAAQTEFRNRITSLLRLEPS